LRRDFPHYVVIIAEGAVPKQTHNYYLRNVVNTSSWAKGTQLITLPSSQILSPTPA